MTFTEFIPLLLGISAASISGAYLTYLILKDKTEHNYEHSIYKANDIEIKVPKSCFSMKNSETVTFLKEIEQKTGTKIILREDTKECNVCTVQGNYKERERAKSIICGTISNHFANLSKEIEYSKKHEIPPERITAYAEVEDKFAENDAAENALHSNDRVVTLPAFKLIQVFVSSVMDPDCFWVQLIDSKATELEDLEKEINAYYAVPENCRVHALGDVCVNDLVAAPFNDDDSLYRARVVEVVSNENGVELELFYLDYGDDERIVRERAFSLKPEFLRLKFQAVQCSLANVEPKRKRWTEEAVDFFCAITDVAKWKVMEAEVVAVGKKGEPVLKLFETKNGRHVDVTDELVRQKHASYSAKQIAVQKCAPVFVASGEEEFVSDDEFEFG